MQSIQSSCIFPTSPTAALTSNDLRYLFETANNNKTHSYPPYKTAFVLQHKRIRNNQRRGDVLVADEYAEVAEVSGIRWDLNLLVLLHD